ncbi:hypothetical protein M9458_052364 [Cirrhinus mrigala]|uniref:Uncharacterized protein n=1 Tax=Cirrhinus mrigala TaxID=683832 RepID=A0ABD0MVR8_CIRMR
MIGQLIKVYRLLASDGQTQPIQAKVLQFSSINNQAHLNQLITVFRKLFGHTRFRCRNAVRVCLRSFIRLYSALFAGWTAKNLRSSSKTLYQ